MHKIKYLFFTIIAVCLCKTLMAQWVQVADFPGLERDDLVVFTCNEKAYAGTGMQTGFQVTNDFYSYDPIVNLWEVIASMPGVPRQYAFSFSFDYVGCVFAGITQQGNDIKDGFQYSVQSESWNILNAYPGAGSRGCAATTFNNCGYAGLGRSDDNLMHNDWWKFDLNNNSWQQLANFPGTERNLASCFESNGFIYIVGGIGTNDVAFNDIWQYNPANDSWQQIISSSFPAFGAAAVCKTKFSGVMFGGFNGLSTFYSDALEFDGFNNSISFLNPFIGFGIKGAKAFSLNNEFYFTCGINENNVRLKSTWKYTQINATNDNFTPNIKFTLMPNPANDKFQIIMDNFSHHENCKYSISTLNNNIIQEGIIHKNINKITIFTDALAAGFYVVKITCEDSEITQKLLIFE